MKLTRLVMEFEDGTRKELIGEDAANWERELNRIIAVNLPRREGVDFNWTVSKKDRYER